MAKKLEPRLPKVDMALADRIEAYLTTKFTMRRPPVISSRLLALLIQMAETNMEFPSREWVATHLDCSKYTIDGALTQAMARGLLTTHLDTQVSDGYIKTGKQGITRHIWYVPTPRFKTAVAAPVRTQPRRVA